VSHDRAAEERQRLGRVAAVAGPLLSLLVPTTMPLIGFSAAETRTWAALIVPVMALAGLAAWLTPWRRLPDAALLAVPLTAWGCLAILGVESHGRASAYAGYSALLFLFIGLTQQPWTCFALLPIAVLTQVALYGGFSTQLAARVPISLVVWVATAEIVARYRARSLHAFDAMEIRANIDPLTELENRHDLGRLLGRLHPDDAVLLIDIDRFKWLNDSAGHAAGDDVLRDFGAAVRDVIRVGDRAVRYGGEEFLVLLPGAGVTGAQRLDERLRAAWQSLRPDVTFSAGIAVVGHVQRPVLDRADAALYAAKESGRNCTLVDSVVPGRGAPAAAPGGGSPDRVAPQPLASTEAPQ
jgi:diguanylate cyclase (GGDEF)-like protein